MFSDDEVIEGVADVFAARGFKGTSVQMLADASGLGKQSLYNSFGDKQTLYLKALDCASARFGAVVDEMARAPDGRRAIDLFFERLLCQCLSADPAEHACIVSAGLLEGLSEAPIADALRSKWASSHALLEAIVRRGQADGSVGASDPPAELADLLMALMGGLRVSARAVPDPTRLHKTIGRALSLLDTASAG
ncbi:MAG: TetR/AcrR family transcriptional regulator [Gemmatimonadaceae bacterium]|nr:TetR/AcrR family transcriptional regulator [Acetobacteraceae bacterium]